MATVKNNLPSSTSRSRKSDNPNDYEFHVSYKESKDGSLGGEIRTEIAKLAMCLGTSKRNAAAVAIKIALQSPELQNYDYLEAEISKLEEEHLQAVNDFEQRRADLVNQQGAPSLLKVLG